MASDVSGDYLRGLGIPEERINLANLQPRGTGNTESAYTEASPRAGTPEAQQSTDMVLTAVGTPSAEGHIRIQAQRAGHPGLEKAGFVWSDQTQDTPVWYGWDGPQLISGWESFLWTTSAITDYDPIPVVIRLQSGALLAVWGQSTAGTQPVKMSRYAPATSTWTQLSSLTLDDPGEQGGCALLELPDASVLLFVQTASADQVDVYRSTDDGTSWSAYAKRVLDTPTTVADIRRLSAAYSNGEVLLIAQWDDGGAPPAENAAQYASDDLGCSFTQVQADWENAGSENPEMVNIISLQAGGFLVVYHDGDSGTPKYYSRALGSAFNDITDTTAIEVAAGAGSAFTPGCAAWRDEDGIIYALVHTTGASKDVIPYRSEDEGATWSAFASTAFYSGNEGDGYFHSYSASSTGGRTFLITRWFATVADEDPYSVAAIALGGFSTHTAPAGEDTTSYQDTDYIAWSDNAAGTDGGSWLPIEEPDQVAWTPTTAGVSTEDLVSPGELEISTGVGQSYYERTASGDYQACFAEFAVELDAGDGSRTADRVTFNVRLADPGGTYEYEVQIRLAADGFRAYDVQGAADVGTEVNVASLLETRLHIRIAIDGAGGANGNVYTWYSRAEQDRVWTAGPNGTISDGGAGATMNRVRFGNTGSNTDVSRWALVGYSFWPGTWGPETSDFAADWSSPEDLHSRSFPSTPLLVFDGVKVAAVSGPAKYGDQWDIKQDSDYSAANMLWQVEPSPSRGTRTTSEIEAKYVFDLNGLTKAAMKGTSLFVGLINTNVEEAVLEGSVNGLSWSTVVTLNASTDLDNLQFERTGEIVYPLKAGAAHKAGRYLYADDLAGGTFYDTTNTKRRRIKSNSNGAWTDETAAIPYAWLEDVDDTEATSGGCELWAPSVFEVIHEQSLTYRYLRLRIPAQTTADGYFEIGQFLLGHIEVFGHQHGRAWSVVRRPQQDVSELPNGSTRAVKRGKALDEVEISWPDAVDSTQPDLKNPVPDYVTGTAGGDPLASYGDTVQNMAGILRQLGGAETPVVFFGKILRSAGGLDANNPRQRLYGRITSDFERSNVLGDETVSELNRGGRVTVVEIT